MFELTFRRCDQGTVWRSGEDAGRVELLITEAETVSVQGLGTCYRRKKRQRKSEMKNGSFLYVYSMCSSDSTPVVLNRWLTTLIVIERRQQGKGKIIMQCN